MKLQMIAFLIMIQLSAFAQIQWPSGLVTEKRMKAYVDSSILAGTLPIPVDPVGPGTPCKEGPTILAITGVTNSYAGVKFHGVEVYELSFRVLDASGTMVSSGTITPKSSDIMIPYINLAAGTYTLELSGTSCSGVDRKQFTIPKNQSSTEPTKPVEGRGNFELFLNTTGYGFDPNDPTGIHPNWQKNIENGKFDWGYAYSGIRLNMKWTDWEPTEGSYQVQALQNAIQYCRERGLKLSVFFWPWRNVGDGFFPESEIATDQRGRKHMLEGNKVMASLESHVANRKIYNAIHALSKELATYEGGYYVSIGTATAEEFINPAIFPDGLCGFEPVFMESFRSYMEDKGKPFVMPEVYDWGAGVVLNMSRESSKDFARFISLSLTRYFENFTKAVKDGSHGKLLSCYMYPDAGGTQNAWFLHANFTTQAASADAMYGTDGTDMYNLDKKLLCNAINLGMGKISIIEYDSEDLGFGIGLPPHCSGIDVGAASREWEKAYSSGTQVISLAMDFCASEIKSLEPIFKAMHEKYICHPYVRPDWPTTTFDIAPDFFAGKDIYAPHWTGKNFVKGDPSNFLEKFVGLNPDPARSFGMGSKYVEGKQMYVHLPAEYDGLRRFPVLYMMDGQDLFGEGQDKWNFDATADRLIKSGEVKPFIIVGVSSGARRFREYQPSAVWGALSQRTRDLMISEYGGGPLGDEFITFLTKELKPYIDLNYATSTATEDTYIGGSSMGGLISVYAVAKAPEVFGGCLGISTHWLGSLIHRETDYPQVFTAWLSKNMPNNKRLYFDYGTEDLDNYYIPLQKEVDKVLQARYASQDYASLVFEDTGHAKSYWRSRASYPLKFLFQ